MPTSTQDSVHTLVSKKEAKLRKRSLKPTATGSLETAMRPGSGPDPCVTTPPPRPAGGSPPGLATAGAGGRDARKCCLRVPAALGIVGDWPNGVGESEGQGKLALKLLVRLTGDDWLGRAPR